MHVLLVDSILLSISSLGANSFPQLLGSNYICEARSAIFISFYEFEGCLVGVFIEVSNSTIGILKLMPPLKSYFKISSTSIS